MKFKIAVLVISVYCLTLIAHIPASLLGKVLPNSVKMSQLTGTLWQGNAAILNIKQPQLSLKNVQWDISLFSSLFNFALVADIAFSNGPKQMSGDAHVEYGSDGIRLSNLTFDMNSQALMPLLSLPLPVTVTGELSLNVPDFTQGAPYCEQLQGTLIWNNATVDSQFGHVDLASPRTDLSCDNGHVVALMTQQSEQLRSQLKATLLVGNAYQLTGEIEATEKLPATIAQSLTWLGKKNDAGATQVNLKGKL